MVSQWYHELFITIVFLVSISELPRFLSYNTLLTVAFHYVLKVQVAHPTLTLKTLSVAVWRPQRGYFLCSYIKVWHSSSCGLHVEVQADRKIPFILKFPVTLQLLAHILYLVCSHFVLMTAWLSSRVIQRASCALIEGRTSDCLYKYTVYKQYLTNDTT